MTEHLERLRAPTPHLDAALRASEDRFRDAFDAAAIGFALIELDGRYRATNRSFSEMLGYTQAELAVRSVAQITHPDDVSVTEAHQARLLSGEIQSFRIEKRYVHKDGHVVWTVVAMTLVNDQRGAPDYFVSQVTDLTARKEAEQALARHTANLERSNADLEAFAYVASHDLQQPLRTVSSYAQLFRDRYHGQLDERADRWLGFIMAGVERMQRLVNDLLALARIRTDGGGFTPTDTRAIVERTWHGLKASYGTDHARLSLRTLPVISADEAQLQQLFQNLLDNAWKYRRPMVMLHVAVAATRHAGGDAVWEFSVRDNGIGLDMTHADRIFEIFQRLHREQDYGGTGIGLAICRRIVERHGGRIWVRARPGHGATFSFTLAERHAARRAP
jgi:PAS domain S-box-containing protein